MGNIKDYYHEAIEDMQFQEEAARYQQSIVIHPHPDDVKDETNMRCNKRMFGNFGEMQDETKEFLRLEDRGDLYLIVATPYDEKYKEDQKWYEGNLAFRAVSRMIPNRPDYVMTRESLDCAKAHINCLVYSKTDLIKRLHDKNKYKYHYHVQKVDRPTAARDYIFKDSCIYSFINGEDYVIHYRVPPLAQAHKDVSS